MDVAFGVTGGSDGFLDAVNKMLKPRIMSVVGVIYPFDITRTN
jgi:hypothetical protein